MSNDHLLLPPRGSQEGVERDAVNPVMLMDLAFLSCGPGLGGCVNPVMIMDLAALARAAKSPRRSAVFARGRGLDGCF